MSERKPRELEAILAELRDWFLVRAGMTPKRLSVEFDEGGRFERSMPRPHGILTHHEPPSETSESGGRSQRNLLYLKILEESGHRLSRTRMLAEMTRRGAEVSERTVAADLALLVEEGTLDNDARARPPGYGLPEWTSTSDD